jgi:predicted metal-dependent hydrolase
LSDRDDLRSLLCDGLAEYHAGRYPEAHDLWEVVWRDLDGDERIWLQGLIMLAAAALHSERGRWLPARNLLIRASQLLQSRNAVAGLAVPSDLADRALAAAKTLRPENPPVSLR